MATTRVTRSTQPSEAQKMIERLVRKGMKNEEIAFKLGVSLNSVIRWRKGVTPIGAHMKALRDFMETQKAS